MPPRPRLLLADDHTPFLQSVRHVLAPAFDIVAVAGDGRQALELATRVRPDVIVLDVAMPGLNGFQTLDQRRRDCPGTRVVFLTMHQEEQVVMVTSEATRIGVAQRLQARQMNLAMLASAARRSLDIN